MATQEIEAPRTMYATTSESDPKNLKTWQRYIDLLNHRLIEINTRPELSKSKLIVISKPVEIGKLLKQMEIMRETWIALKFKNEIFVIWKEIVFLCLKENCKNLPSKE